MAALKTVGVPVFFGGWYPDGNEQPPATYITFTAMSRPALFQDDARTGWRHYVYMSLWSTAPYQSIREKLFELMEEAGFVNCDYHNLTGGIVAVHRGFKK